VKRSRPCKSSDSRKLSPGRFAKWPEPDSEASAFPLSAGTGECRESSGDFAEPQLFRNGARANGCTRHTVDGAAFRVLCKHSTANIMDGPTASRAILAHSSQDQCQCAVPENGCGGAKGVVDCWSAEVFGGIISEPQYNFPRSISAEFQLSSTFCDENFTRLQQFAVSHLDNLDFAGFVEPQSK